MACQELNSPETTGTLIWSVAPSAKDRLLSPSDSSVLTPGLVHPLHVDGASERL